MKTIDMLPEARLALLECRVDALVTLLTPNLKKIKQDAKAKLRENKKRLHELKIQQQLLDIIEQRDRQQEEEERLP